ncbi:MAG: hypothetical protein ACYDAA_09645 [Syntrophales bacterium]
MDNNELKALIKRLVDEAVVVAPSISRFDEDGNYGRVTDENLDSDSLVSWELEARTLVRQVASACPAVFEELYTDYNKIKEESRKWHSRSILVHRMRQLLASASVLLESPLVRNAVNSGAVIDGAARTIEKTDPWKDIEKEYGISKKAFGKKINFVKDDFKRRAIFRDIEQAYFLAFNGYSKPAVILAGGVIEELLRLYIECKGIKSENNTLDSYIRTCGEEGILKKAVNKLADSFREFRNLVHLQREESPRHSISTPTAKSAVASVFIVIDDFDT